MRRELPPHDKSRLTCTHHDHCSRVVCVAHCSFFKTARSPCAASRKLNVSVEKGGSRTAAPSSSLAVKYLAGGNLSSPTNQGLPVLENKKLGEPRTLLISAWGLPNLKPSWPSAGDTPASSHLGTQKTLVPNRWGLPGQPVHLMRNTPHRTQPLSS